MSYSLTVSGHTDPADTAKTEQVHAILVEKGAEIVAALRELDAFGEYPAATVSGPVGYVNLLADPDEPQPDAGG